MTEQMPLPPEINADQLAAALKNSWKWFLVLGALFIVLGFIGLSATFFMTMTGVMLFGAMAICGGVVNFIYSFRASGWPSRSFLVFMSVIYVLAGILMVSHPVIASEMLTLLIGVSLLLTGFLRCFIAVQNRVSVSWGWVLASGLLAVVLGIFILAQWPESSFFIIGLFISIEFIMNGLGITLLALSVRSVGGRQAAP